MTKAAVPNYMTKHIESQDVAPGHRFGLYFPVWQDNWSRAESGKKEALKTVAKSLSPNSIKLTENLRQRQQSIALKQNAEYFPAKSIAPFMTGIGNEHPLENGFAFINPYGLPYLPGSSVKGVLRTAAEQLALGLYGDKQGWDMLSVWWLFGFEAGGSMFKQSAYGIDVLDEEAQRRQAIYQEWLARGEYEVAALKKFIECATEAKDKKRYIDQPQAFLNDLALNKTLRESISIQGALCFWDVFPESKSLAMDILTPHHGGYFNGKNSPHDSEQPVPNVLLTLPPNSQFDFYCTCAEARLPEFFRQHWKTLLKATFEHAFDWLGFGAKTAVGYGQMNFDQGKIDALVEYQEQMRLEALSTEQKLIQELRQKLQTKQKSKVSEQIGGPLYTELKQLITAADKWSRTDKDDLLEIARLLVEFIGAKGNKKAKELLTQLQN